MRGSEAKIRQFEADSRKLMTARTLWLDDLPATFLVTIGLQALTTLVLVHLETALLFEVTHGVKLV